MGCVECGRDLEAAFRFCPWCAAPQRRKLVEFFPGHRGFARDRRRALRVSRYLRTREQEPHVRFSVWSERGRVEAAMSLDEDEAARLAAFLQPPARRPRTFRELLEQIRL